MAATKLKQCCDLKQDNTQHLADLSGKQWGNIVATELQYHRSCYRDYTRASRILSDDDNVIEKLFPLIKETVLDNNNVMTSNEMLDKYNSLLLTNFKAISDARLVIDPVLAYFAVEVSLHTPQYGCAFVFKDNQSKGQIINRFMKKLRAETTASEATEK